jgi:hypothetical protein
MLQLPDHMYCDRDNTFIGASLLSPADSVIATLGNKGTRRHLGTESRPPVALRYSHIAFNQDSRGRQYDGYGKGVRPQQQQQQQTLPVVSGTG